jgi:FixJ family two-component response regulator
MTEPEPIIVLVDDDAGMNQAVQRLLNAAGFRTLTFPSGEALLETGIGAGSACFVFDVHLPGLSGFDLQARLARSGADLPVIFITADDDPESQARAHQAGAIAYLTKPFGGQKLVSAINKALASAAPRSSNVTS